MTHKWRLFGLFGLGALLLLAAKTKRAAPFSVQLAQLPVDVSTGMMIYTVTIKNESHQPADFLKESEWWPQTIPNLTQNGLRLMPHDRRSAASIGADGSIPHPDAIVHIIPGQSAVIASGRLNANEHRLDWNCFSFYNLPKGQLKLTITWTPNESKLRVGPETKKFTPAWSGRMTSQAVTITIP
jgi:hypothetical protein